MLTMVCQSCEDEVSFETVEQRLTIKGLLACPRCFRHRFGSEGYVQVTVPIQNGAYIGTTDVSMLLIN